MRIAVGGLRLGRQDSNPVAGRVGCIGQVGERRVGDVMAGAAKILALVVAAVELLMFAVGIGKGPAFRIGFPGVEVVGDQENMPSTIFRVACAYRDVVGIERVSIEKGGLRPSF